MPYLTTLRKIVTFLGSWVLLCLFLQGESYLYAENTNLLRETEQPHIEAAEEVEEEPPIAQKRIRNIIFEGNTLISDEALRMRVPYKVGEPFNPTKTAELIRTLYALNYFDAIEVSVEDVSPTELDLYISLQEKKRIEGVVYEGNRNLKADEIEKKLHLSDIPAVNEEELALYADQIKKLYAEKNFHAVSIRTELRPTERGTYNAVFIIEEGRKAVVKRVFFQGNNCISSRILRKMIFTREDWLFGFADKAGTYQPDALEYDKYVIETFYQSSGFLAARVTDVKVVTDPATQNISVTFCIEEGELYTIKCVSAPGNDLLSEAQLLALIPVRPGQLYSRELIRQSLERLRLAWGSFGYIYADIEPVVQPNFEEKTVDITFNSELGSKVFLNRINIIGNSKTRDHVIRRALLLNEGELLTTPAMDISKSKVEALGFFEPRAGVEWRINKISEGLVDLDLVLNEIKTGKLYGQIGFGGADPQSPSTSLKVSAGVSDRNLFGTGIRYNVNLSWSKEDRSVVLNLFQPWLFDYPVGVGFDAYHRKSLYEDFSSGVKDIPVETLTGVDGQVVFSPQSFPDLGMVFNGGVEHISYAAKVEAQDMPNKKQQRIFQALLDRRFQPGTLNWLGGSIGQDLRNHPVFPSRGYNWNFSVKTGLPTFSSNYGFFKFDLDASWLTPLIGESDLIFLLHGHAGLVKPFNNRLIPYRELYHVGGPGTVRGFTFGQIGPKIFGDSIGAEKAFWVNAELIFSVTKNQSIRGVLFYDGGAGWDTPNAASFKDLPIQNNRFQYRHAIGFGIRLTHPIPLKIDWAFKLDRNKRLGEKFFEVHFSMAQEF
jgi:outer membrane protein insertion porin family